jgi:hypothetical protein
LNGNYGFAVTGTNTFDYAGFFVTGISDINGDRIDDILISAPGSLGGTPGKSYVIYGHTTGFSPKFNLAEINNNNGFVINGIDSNLVVLPAAATSTATASPTLLLVSMAATPAVALMQAKLTLHSVSKEDFLGELTSQN